MNVVLPKQYRVSKADIVIYTVAIVICVVALTVIITMQFLGEGIFHTNKIQIATEEELLRLRTEFDNMFLNQFIGEGENISKKDASKNFVFTSYENTDNVEGNYILNVHIPEFNIQDENLNKLNEEINETYKRQVSDILSTKGNQTMYSVEYASYIENQVLFLVIRSNIKQGNQAQKCVIQTYQYDLENKKQINLEEMLEKLEYDKNDVQNKIREEIKREENNSKSLQELGYPIYIRDSQSDIYKIENSKQFFVRNGKLHIIYSYGNESLTSEMDFVIL